MPRGPVHRDPWPPLRPRLILRLFATILEHLFDSLSSLNEAQRRAVTHGGGPLLVVAGAGSGKTKTLAARVAWLLERGVAPERILLLTFSRRASREMLARAQRSAGAAASRVWGGTFHATGNRLLRLYGRAIGVQPDFTVLDQADGADLMNLVRGDLGLGTKERRFPRKDTLATIYSRTVNSRTPLRDVLGRWFPWCREEADGIREVFRGYTARKRATNVLDYDDLLLYWAALLPSDAGARVAALFEHVLVDEYQDTNVLQAEILKGLANGSPNVMVVGDDAQAIYGFRSATVRNILEFPQQFPGATVVKLEQNYRSTPPLLEVSNAVIALSPQRHEKTLWSARRGERQPVLLTCVDEADQSDAVCRALLEHREQGVALRRQAVLFRTGHHSDHLELELTRRNIPFVKYGGLKFLESAHVKDALALLRMLENPHDEVSWFRALQLLDGVGPAGARRMLAELGVRDRGGDAPLARLLDRPPRVPDSAVEDLASLRAALRDCLGEGAREREPGGVAPQLERLSGFLRPVFERRYESPEMRLRDLEQLELMAAGAPSRGRFLADLTLDPPTSTSDLAGPPLLDEDYVILSTIHSAKGGEWDVIHVIHAADGMIPSDMATGDADEVEEERRLFYVALTRARDALHVYFPMRYHRRPRGLDDTHHYGQLTRFLPPDVGELFDRRTTAAWDEAQTAPRDVAQAAGSRAVDDFLASLWS
jgi:DNA helicase II / ATP-dependent DNA helicase PcrA